jgi:hypothetical protein
MRGYDVRRFVVHRPARSQRGLSTLSPGVKALSVERLKDLWLIPHLQKGKGGLRDGEV